MRFVRDFTQKWIVDLSMLCWVKQFIEGLPKVFDFNVQSTIVLDSFNSWKFPFLDPVHKFLWTFLFVQNFLYFTIKKFLFRNFDCFFEKFLIVQSSWIFISFWRNLIFFIPPQLWIPSDIDQFLMFEPDIVCIISKFLYIIFKIFFVVNIKGIETTD